MAKSLLHGLLYLRSLVPLCAAAIAIDSTLAADPVMTNGAELVQACRNEQSGEAPQSGGLCEGYLFGYVDAHPEIAFRADLPSEYMQRVLQTRAPAHSSTNVVKQAVYCLESVNTLREISASIARMDPESVVSSTPSQVIKDILDKHYRCQS